MFFDRLITRFSFQNDNTKSFNPLRSRFHRKESARRCLEAVNELIADKEYEKALKAINTTFQNKISSNKLLLKKAFLLLEGKKHKEAHEILSKLAELKNNPRLTASAQKLLRDSQKNQLKDTARLIKSLQKKANKYDWRVMDIAKNEDFSPGLDIAHLARNEAQRARAADLPKLSADLIEITLKAGYTSPWLVHDQALSFNMMGQQEKAIELLEDLRQTIKNPKIQSSIKRSIDKFAETPIDRQKTRFYMVKQARRVAKANQIEIQFIPKTNEIDNKINLQALILKEAQGALPKKPTAALNLTDSVLDYFPSNIWALEKKSLALISLRQHDKAFSILKELIKAENQNIAKKASQSFTELLTIKANLIREKKSHKEAINFFIEQHLNYKLIPTFTPKLKNILKEFDTNNDEFFNSELERYHLQMLFNTLLIDHIEAQLRDQGRLNDATPSQKTGAISETAPKAR